MYLTTFILFFMLFTKHFVIDFINQSQEEVNHKGIWGDWLGFKHSLKHGIVTGLLLILFKLNIELIILIIVGETCIHYVIDYVKMKYGCRDIKEKSFWIQLGLDQYLHYLTYLLIAVIVYL